MMEGPNEPTAQRSSARLDQTYTPAGFQYSFTLAKEERGVGKMVEDVQQQHRGDGFTNERQRQSRADDVNFRSRAEVNRDYGRPDLPIESPSSSHFHDDAARRSARHGRFEVLVVMQIQSAQKTLLADQPRMDGSRFR